METKVFRLTFALYILGILSNTQLLPLCVILAFVISAHLNNHSTFACHITAFCLGYLTGMTPFALVSASANKIPFAFIVYMSSMSVAHMFEYLFVCAFHFDELKWDSYLINQSKQYVAAAMVSWVEFYLEFGLIPESVTSLTLKVGLVCIFIGHYLRIGAMFTAAKSFHHIVQSEKAPTHVLVTDGVYSWFRHPSYFGWGLWAIGTQIILCNPFSMVAYAFAAQSFFASRIPYEEYQLVEFFGEAYKEYARKVPIRIPYIKSRF